MSQGVADRQATPAFLTVGLTGGIGSGKSFVGELFAELGIPTIDADRVAREVVAAGSEALAQIAERFGADVVSADGTLDRSRLTVRAFADDTSRKALEAIVHPRVWSRITTTLSALEQNSAARAPYAVVVVPLLIEAGWVDRVDRVLVVDCSEEQQVARVRERDGRSPAEIRRIMQAQASRRERLARADDVVDNSGSRAALRPQVLRLHELYRRLARQ